MDQSFIHAGEWVGTTWVPDSPFGWIALMGHPDMSLKILKLVILCYLLCIAYNLEDHHVASMRQNKGLLLPQGGVELLIEFKTVLKNKFIFSLSDVHILETVLLDEPFQHFFSNPSEITPYIWGPGRKSLNHSIIIDCGNSFSFIYVQEWLDTLLFNCFSNVWIKQSGLD